MVFTKVCNNYTMIYVWSRSPCFPIYTVKTDWLKQPYFLVATFLNFVILTNCELVSENDQLNLVPLTLFNWSK